MNTEEKKAFNVQFWRFLWASILIGLSACLVTGLVLTAYGVLTPDVVTHLLCDNEQLYQPTYEYLRVMLLGAPVYLLMWGL